MEDLPVAVATFNVATANVNRTSHQALRHIYEVQTIWTEIENYRKGNNNWKKEAATKIAVLKTGHSACMKIYEAKADFFWLKHF